MMDLQGELLTAVGVVVGISFIIFLARKLFESQKRKALNDSTSAKSGHYWSPVELVEHGFFCVCCKENLTTGYECDFCTLKVDSVNCARQIAVKTPCKVVHSKNSAADNMKHHWIPGNIEEEKFCVACDELCGGGVGLQDFRCSWCVQVVHSRCKAQIDEECDFGQLKRFIIPPYCVTTRKSVNRSQRYPVVDTMKLPEDGLQWQPIIAVVNPKSGSGAGKGVLRKLRAHLHPVQVIDITKSHLRSSLAWLDEQDDLKARILIAGGDGTISSVLDEIDKLSKPLSVSVLPLGTGNDLSRVLNWGNECDGHPNVIELFEEIIDAKPIKLDRWTVQVDHKRKLGVRLFNKTLSMTNYLSIGVDACVTLGMQTTRNSIPRALSSRVLNKFLFFTYGTKDVFERACKGLNNNIQLFLDDKTEPETLPDIEGLVFLNISSWGAGVKPWDSAPDEMKQTLDDGMFEIFAVTSSFHIAQLQVGWSFNSAAYCSSKKSRIKSRPRKTSDAERWRSMAAISRCDYNHAQGRSMSGHVARRARMDALMSSSAHATPRSVSWSRTKTPGSVTQRATIRSVSVSRVKPKDDSKEKEQQEAARAAFQEWLKRKSKEPRGPRASPSREQISKHLKDDQKHRIFNTWLYNPKFERKSQQNGTNGTSD